MSPAILESIFHHVHKTPDHPAIEEEGQITTYRRLVSEAQHLSKALGTIACGDPIAILMGPGTHQVVCQLAVLLAGGVCVPIEPTLPERRVKEMLQGINTKLVLISQNMPYDLNAFNTMTPQFLGDQPSQSPVLKVPQDSNKTISHILFTSGSTGKPKPVQIPAQALVHLASQTPATPLHRKDRVAAFNNPGFDLSLFEYWVTLISGATMVVVPRKVATDPGAFSDFLKTREISIVIITASLFQITVSRNPKTFSSMRHVLTAGDVANVQAMRSVLSQGPPLHLWNTYGPTECTTLTTMGEVTDQEVQNERVSIGHAVGDMEVYLLDENRKPIWEKGVSGEIHIAGPQQATGYLNQVDQTNLRFFEVSSSELGRQRDGKTRLYQTGDLAEWRPGHDCLDFVGRADQQVKHQGFRVELGEIERVLLGYDGVESVAVVRVPPSSQHGMHALVAYICCKGAVDTQAILQFARDRLPFYMVPNTFEAIEEFPLTPNGKVDRRALIQRRLNAIEPVQSLPNGDTTSEKSTLIRDLWKALLNVPEVHDHDDFFALGASSLQAASFIASVHEQLGLLISMEDLYTHKRFDALLRLLHITNVGHGQAPDNTRAWMDDTNLIDDINLVPHWEAESEGRVFITGATGFVGAHLLEHLMRRPNVKQIACLVRSKNGLSPFTRLQRALERYDLWPSSFEMTQKLRLLDGDLTASDLGLGQEKYDWLANWASIIFHLGAKVNFCESYREHYQPNIIGTKNALQLAASGRRKAFHYISSIDAWGPTGCILGTRELWEDEPLQPHIQGLRYDLGYAQSQWAAEEMVRGMRDKGLPVVIYRPGFIIGDSKTGSNNPDDFVSRLIVGCIEMGTFPKLDQRLEYVTIDYVIDAMMRIASSPDAIGQSFHLLSPDVSRSVTVEETCEVINNAGYPVKLVPYEQWVKQALQEQKEGPLGPLFPMFQEPVLGRLTRWEASQYSPIYRCDNTSKILHGKSGMDYCPLEHGMLQRFIDFWNYKGFYHVERPALRN